MGMRQPEGAFSLLENGRSRLEFSASDPLREDSAEGDKSLRSLQRMIDCLTSHFERLFETYTCDHNVRCDGLWEFGKSNIVGPIYMQFEQFGKAIKGVWSYQGLACWLPHTVGYARKGCYGA
ncbi:hypothetical protein DR64_1320 [Paraburkholderia xenovorans LB400]|nr:hypothetical protein DR64_1320 [Paraburkholderia xenovorans LB400]